METSYNYITCIYTKYSWKDVITNVYFLNFFCILLITAKCYKRYILLPFFFTLIFGINFFHEGHTPLQIKRKWFNQLQILFNIFHSNLALVAIGRVQHCGSSLSQHRLSCTCWRQIIVTHWAVGSQESQHPMLVFSENCIYFMMYEKDILNCALSSSMKFCRCKD